MILSDLMEPGERNAKHLKCSRFGTRPRSVAGESLKTSILLKIVIMT